LEAISLRKNEAGGILTTLLSGFHRRQAVSTIVGGLIILSLILTALGAMVFVSQQYDQYQRLVRNVGQYDNQRLSESLVINSPGMAILTSSSVPGWGSGCMSTYNCYNISISNMGGVGVEIMRIYINSTGPAGSGCSYSTSSPNPQPCILNPTSAIGPYAFNQANRFLNPGEVNHAVQIALPYAVTLPDPTPAVPQNTILIVTSRGNVFSFQWPVPILVFGQSQSAFSSGTMKVAYTGSGSGAYDSANEPGLGGSGTSSQGYCHQETVQSYPAGAGYAEKLTGLGTYGDSGVLWFVTPWVTDNILVSIANGNTVLYLYVNIINTGTTPYKPVSGSIDLGWYSANHLDGNIIGVYFKNQFYLPASAPTIAPTQSYYAIYQIIKEKLQNDPSGFSSEDLNAVMFWGDASITDWSGTSAESTTYFSATVLLPGLWIRSKC
jgi:hypothetical protein